jgi:hypothetical protein
LAPDEATHFEAIRLIGQERLWPTESVYQTTPMHPQMRASFEKFRVWQISGLPAPQGLPSLGNPALDTYINYYPAHNGGSVIIAGRYPLFYHLMLAPLAAALKSLTIEQQLYLLRLTSMFFTTLVVVMGWFFARAIFPQLLAYRVAVASFLVFLPMHLHIGTALNTDVFATLLASVYFLALAKVFCDSPALRWKLTTAVFFVAAIFTKPTTLFIVPVLTAAAIIYTSRRFCWPGWWRAAMLAGLVAMVGAGSVFFFQFSNGGRGVATLSFSGQTVDWAGNYFSREALAVYIHTIRWGFLSFWGLFGWVSIPIPTGWSRILWAFSGVIVGGIGLFFFRNVFQSGSGKMRLKPYQQDFLAILLVSVIFALMGMYTPIIATQSRQWGPPSRYFFPGLLPFSLLFYLGFQQLFPARLNDFILPAWIALLIIFDSAVVTFLLLPFIYG